MEIKRRNTKVIKIGKVYIGGKHSIAIQSMAKTKTSDIENTIKQVTRLANAGCDIVRLAVKDAADARAIKKIKRKVNLPLVADIHFDWRLALEAIDNGADKIRLNPGNIHKKEQIREIAKAARLAGIPIRVGLNSGSLPNAKRKAPASPAGRQSARRITEVMVKSALDYIKILEGFKFRDIVVSLKASDILDTIEAYRRMSRLCDYPMHLGLTATGLPFKGAIKSAIAIGALLSEGIGDTIRVSLTDNPEEEIKAARAILEALNLRHFGPRIISCPTCGRCEVDLLKIVKELENRLTTYDLRLTASPLKVAIMGCVVNGPGESKEADIGIAFGKKDGLLFRNGKAIKKVPFNECIDILLKEIAAL